MAGVGGNASVQVPNYEGYQFTLDSKLMHQGKKIQVFVIGSLNGKNNVAFQNRISTYQYPYNFPQKFKDLKEFHSYIQSIKGDSNKYVFSPEDREIIFPAGDGFEEFDLDLIHNYSQFNGHLLEFAKQIQQIHKAYQEGNIPEEQQAQVLGQSPGGEDEDQFEDQKIQKLMIDFEANEKHYLAMVEEDEQKVKEFAEDVKKLEGGIKDTQTKVKRIKENFEKHIGMSMEDWKAQGYPCHPKQFAQARNKIQQIENKK